jgi:hypothetical protein
MISFNNYLLEATKTTIKFNVDADWLVTNWDKLEKLGAINVPKKGPYSIVIDPKDESKLVKLIGKKSIVKQ